MSDTPHTAQSAANTGESSEKSLLQEMPPPNNALDGFLDELNANLKRLAE